MRAIRFSQQYGVTRQSADDWFDPLLNEDTKLYVDPFLIFLDEDPVWTNAHPRLMEFFNMVMELLADSGFNPKSSLFTKAKSLLRFPEPPEFCLGMSEESIFGAGSSTGLQAGMLEGAATVIDLGIDSLKHFEELALFGEQIGGDRIGDMACDVLKEEFIAYTQAVAHRHGIPLETVDVKTAGWDAERKIWKPGLVELPLNPIATQQAGRPVGVLLAPKRFLRRFPTVAPAEFWDFAWSVEGEQLRADFNYELGRHVNAKTIARLARRKRHLLTAYLDNLAGNPKPPYDVDEDPDLIVRRADFGKIVADTLTAPIPQTEDEFLQFVSSLVDNFKQCVEHRGAGDLLWVDGKPRFERHAQKLFQTSAVMSCFDRDIDISPESNAGRGPVDFKLSQGKRFRVLLELKLAKSTHFWRNLEHQTPIYAKAEGIRQGYFIVIQFDNADCSEDFMNKARSLARKVGEKNDINFDVVFVDARPKKSASKAGPGDP